MLRSASFITIALLTLTACAEREPEIPMGVWRATAALPGGELPFGLELAERDGGHVAYLINGSERVEVPDVRIEGTRLAMEMPGFNNRIEAELAVSGRLVGQLTLVKRYGVQQHMPLVAVPDQRYRFFDDWRDPSVDLSGRWAVTFSEPDDKTYQAVGEFVQQGQSITGTFLTTTGDHRFLEGDVRDGMLHLSTFDGAHAFLYRAEIDRDRLIGEFWSGTQWRETFEARRDANARLADADTLTYLKPGFERLDFTFPDLDGNPISLSDPRFDGKVVVIMLSGSWCPNCHDEARFMAPFYAAHRERGLEMIGLMFEHFGSFEQAAETTRLLKEKFDIEYELLIAGISDKDSASEQLPMLNGVLAFPTTIFIDRRGEVRRIHTGFAGPGTGEHYEQFKAEFSEFVDELLNEPV